MFKNLKNPFRKKEQKIVADQEKEFNAYSIKLPPDHPLLEYQKNYPKYDKFLSYLALHASPGETIVDIGANVGDSLAAMAEGNPNANYLCVEADDLYYGYLLKNKESILQSFPKLGVQIVHSFVGKNITNVSLEGAKGTKRANLSKPGSVQAVSFDRLAKEMACSVVSVFKSDTDGFDYDVLESAAETIEKDKPTLFFECQIDHELQHNGYLRICERLEAMGYSDWTLFDNFGDILVRTNNNSLVRQMINYLWQKTAINAAKTIYYFDILACQKKDVQSLDLILSKYNGQVLTTN